jgi:hypothetical protein
MKSVSTVCDLCGDIAEREIEVNGKTVAVCSPSCYSLFWSREWEDWRTVRYLLSVSFCMPELVSEIERKLEIVMRPAAGEKA